MLLAKNTIIQTIFSHLNIKISKNVYQMSQKSHAAVGVFDTVEEKSATHNKIFGKVSDATIIDKEQYLV